MRRDMVCGFAAACLLATTIVGCISFKHAVQVKPESKIVDRIDKVVLKSGGIVEFEQAGARFEPTTGLVVGLTSAGTRVLISADSVWSFQCKRVSLAPTIAVNLGICLALSAWAFAMGFN